MKKQTGFTLIEMMIVIAIIGILVSILAGGHSKSIDTKTECIGGYTFAKRGAQIFDANGNGIPCNNGVQVVR